VTAPLCIECRTAEVYVRDWCQPCYDHLRHSGRLEVLRPQKRVDFEEWLASVINTPGCWVWPGGLDSNGYGRATVNGRRRKVHQHVWERLRGPFPEGREPDHLCRNRACANPACAEPVTHKVNMNRGSSPSHIAARMNRCGKDLHDLVGDNVIVTNSGRRRCRACHLAWRRERYAQGLAT
jgi:hypothetical protein